jgi:cytochrome c55X
MREALLALAAVLLPALASGGEIGPERARELERLLRQDCGSCHGMTLRGGLGPDLRAGTLAGADREALAAIILDGVPGKPMPPWRPLLSEAEAHWIADYLIAGGRP